MFFCHLCQNNGFYSLELEMPKQMCFFFLLALFVRVNLEFPLVKSSKIFTAHLIQRETNFKHEKSRVCKRQVFRFLQIYVFYPCEKTGQIDYPEKRAPTKVKHLLPVYQVSRNFTEGNARKFTVSFAFWAHVDVINDRKTLTFFFERAPGSFFPPCLTFHPQCVPSYNYRAEPP